MIALVFLLNRERDRDQVRDRDQARDQAQDQGQDPVRARDEAQDRDRGQAREQLLLHQGYYSSISLVEFGSRLIIRRTKPAK